MITRVPFSNLFSLVENFVFSYGVPLSIRSSKRATRIVDFVSLFASVGFLRNQEFGRTRDQNDRSLADNTYIRIYTRKYVTTDAGRLSDLLFQSADE